MLVRVPLLRPKKRTLDSALTRRCARAVCGVSGRVSSTRWPWQSPYTPVVEPYTSARGVLRRRNDRTKARVRKSSCTWLRDSVAGGARCSTCVASPDKRARLCGSSRLPARGVRPQARSRRSRPGEEVSASKRTRRLSGAPSCEAVRSPMSPQPTISTRGRRKREGKAPRGVWFEGKIADSGIEQSRLG